MWEIALPTPGIDAPGQVDSVFTWSAEHERRPSYVDARIGEQFWIWFTSFVWETSVDPFVITSVINNWRPDPVHLRDTLARPYSYIASNLMTVYSTNARGNSKFATE